MTAVQHVNCLLV